MESFDVIVVGGGPSGCATAISLGKKGRKVLLLDKAKFPRDKTCGDAVSGKTLKALRELDLIPEVEKLPHGKVYGIMFSSPKGESVSIDFPHPEGERVQSGYICRREAYDNMLFQAAKRYCKVIEDFAVTDLIQAGGYVVGVKGTGPSGPAEFKSSVVVGADGATSVVATKLGLSKLDPKHVSVSIRAYYDSIKGLTPNIEIHFVDSIQPGYFWIFPIEDGKANVGLGMTQDELKKRNVNLQAELDKIIKENPLFKERFAEAKLLTPIKGWTLPMGSKRRRATGNGFVLIGDAASLIDPFSGEGIGNGMTSGLLAARIIDAALKDNDVSEKRLKEYEKLLWQEIGPELHNSYILQRIGSFKFLLNFVIHKAAKNKEIQQTISGMLSNETAKKDFISPLFYVKLLLT